MTTDYDVAIAGGGLAGLCVARQLKREYPALRILVVEKRTHPAREAAHKVGESSVEIGAHFFQKVLDLDAHLQADELPKLGLRYFFPQGGNRDIARRAEFGPSSFPAVPSFQLDRGRFENHVLQLNRAAGIEVVDGASVRDLQLGADAHTMEFATPQSTRRVTARWIVDCSGRSGLLRRRLGLTRAVGHTANACWFRIQERLKVDDWSSDPVWRAHVPSGQRWLSTNHLMGRGYWVWLIPLGSGSTSVGIVADEPLHPFGEISRFERAIEWLRLYEPQCAEAVERHRDKVQDFLALKHYAYGCTRVFSPDRWMLLGEAGLFTDPFYSPGSDFIGIGSEFVTDVIGRDLDGQDVRGRIEQYNTTYLGLFDAFLRLYEGQYALMGNAQVMTAKAAWDNACYWAVPALLYFQRRFREPEFLASIDSLMRRFTVLHARMQACLRAWDVADHGAYAGWYRGILDVPFLRELQSALGGEPLDDGPLRARLEANVALLEQFARSLQGMAQAHDPEVGRYVAPAPDETPLDLGLLRVTPMPSDAAQPITTP